MMLIRTPAQFHPALPRDFKEGVMSEKTPFVSVAIASYNYREYVGRMLESVAAQSFRDFELIVSDDGSTDGALNVIREFLAAHPELDAKLVENEHLGLAGNRNSSLTHSRGEYVMFCDADDYLEPDCLEILAAEARKTGADRVMSYVRNVDPEGKELQIETQWGGIKSRWMCNLHHGCLYRRALFDRYGIRFEEAAGGDDFFLSSLYNSYAETAAFVEKPLYNWVVRTESTAGAKKEITAYLGHHMIESVVRPMREIRERLTDRPEDLELFRYQLVRYYYFCIFHSYRYVKLKETFADYGKIRNLMREIDPKYLKNRYITLKKPSPARPYAQKIIWASSKLEKLHLMKPALALYHFLSKFHYFNV